MNRPILLTISILTLAGCASSQANREPTTAPSEEKSGMHEGMMDHGMAGSCPMEVEGTIVGAEDVEGGVALTFTTTGDATELRGRVAHMAKMHGEHHGHGMGKHEGAATEGAEGPAHKKNGGADKHQGGMMADGMMMPPAAAQTAQIEGGVRLVLTPSDPADLAKLREHARHMSEKMASGKCPMMGRSGEDHAPPGTPGADDADHQAHHPNHDHTDGP